MAGRERTPTSRVLNSAPIDPRSIPISYEAFESAPPRLTKMARG